LHPPLQICALLHSIETVSSRSPILSSPLYSYILVKELTNRTNIPWLTSLLRHRLFISIFLFLEELFKSFRWLLFLALEYTELGAF
jgi:hypothetical protein